MTPTLVIAGTQSGVGKTSITLGLCRALARRGVRVQPAKVGPDYLDPTHLSRAAGRPCWNLDPWMMGADYVRALAASCDADLLLVEGVMGLYDGADATGDDGSTAQVARLLDAPVWLVADAHGAARSFAATVHGFATFPGAPRIARVIANRCGSERHVAVLRDALASAGLPPLAGAIPRDGLPSLASRHLGLVAADDRSEPDLNALADAVERQVDLEATMRPSIGASTPSSTSGASTPPSTSFGASTPKTHRHWYHNGTLPHFDAADIYQAITFRLADALPAEVVQRLHRHVEELHPEDASRQARELRRRLETWVDQGHGACLLRRPELAAIVAEVLHAGEGYDLLAWVVMPNHVHVLIRQRQGTELARIVQAWKSVSARRIAELAQIDGHVWQRDYWDRYIRDEAHFQRCFAYVHANPVRAGLAETPERWPWSSARAVARVDEGVDAPGEDVDGGVDAPSDVARTIRSVDALVDVRTVDAPVDGSNSVDSPLLAVAWDAACSFAYADLWPALAARGVRVVRFSPITDAAVPPCDGLFLPGGYPELHAEAIAANAPMRESLRALAASGRPVYAECGGLMLLSQGIELADGRRLPMAGVLPAWTRLLPRRKALGYAEVRTGAPSLFGPAGSVLRGHEFHYSELVGEPAGWEPVYAVAYRRGATAREGWCRGNVLASYVHLHLPSHGRALDAFTAALRGSSPC